MSGRPSLELLVRFLTDLIVRLRDARRITTADVLELRRSIFGEVEVTLAEADALIGLDETVPEAAPGWAELFIEALTDFVVRQQEPSGYVDDEKAEWLMDRLARDGRVRTGTELETLIKVLETAESAPPGLAAFALGHVKRDVMEDGVVTRRETDRVRRVLYAYAGAGVIGVTREEAEALFDINDAARGAANDAAWTDLFVKAVAGSLMNASAYVPPSREEAADRQRWLESRGDIRRGWARVFGARPDWAGALEAVTGPSEFDRASTARAAQNAAAADAARPVTMSEAGWLAERLNRDGALDPAERALLAFIRSEATEVDPLLAPLLDRAA